MTHLLRTLFIVVFFLAGSLQGRAEWKIYHYTGFSSETSNKVARLEQLLAHGDTNSVNFAKEVLISVSDEKSNIWARLNLIATLTYFEHYHQAQEQLTIVQNAILGKDLPEIRAYYLLHKAAVLHLKSEYRGADSIYRALSLEPTAKKNKHFRALIAMEQGHNLRYLGDYETAQIKWYKALEYFENERDSMATIKCVLGIGIIKFLVNDLDKAKEEFDKVEAFWKKYDNPKELSFAYNVLGLWNYGKGNYTRSIDLCTQSYQLRQNQNDIRGQGESLNNLALAYAGLENWDQALKYFRLSLQKLTLGQDLRQVATIQYNIGQILLKQGNLTEAENYFKKGLQRSSEMQQVQAQMIGLKSLSELEESRGNYKVALEFHKSLLAVKDSALHAEKTRALEELEAQYQSVKQEQEIEILQRDKKISSNRWLTLALGLFAVIVISLLVIDGQRKKLKQDTQLHNAQNELVEAELLNTRNELDFNRNKLAIYMENLIRKNDLVQDLEGRIKGFNEGKNNDRPEAKELFLELADSRILTEEDWHQFKDLFNQAYIGFIPKLLNTYPDLTDAEQRLFLLMKMELPTKQIANILGVSPDSVKKARYRLKRKIRLEGSDSLQSVVSSFV